MARLPAYPEMSVHRGRPEVAVVWSNRRKDHTGSRPLGNDMSSYSGHRPLPVSDVHSVSWLFGKRLRDHSQPVAFFRPPSGIPLLKPSSRCCDVILGKCGIPAKQEALLISDWQRKCPRPMV